MSKFHVSCEPELAKRPYFGFCCLCRNECLQVANVYSVKPNRSCLVRYLGFSPHYTLWVEEEQFAKFPKSTLAEPQLKEIVSYKQVFNKDFYLVRWEKEHSVETKYFLKHFCFKSLEKFHQKLNLPLKRPNTTQSSPPKKAAKRHRELRVPFEKKNELLLHLFYEPEQLITRNKDLISKEAMHNYSSFFALIVEVSGTPNQNFQKLLPKQNHYLELFTALTEASKLNATDIMFGEATFDFQKLKTLASIIRALAKFGQLTRSQKLSQLKKLRVQETSNWKLADDLALLEALKNIKTKKTLEFTKPTVQPEEFVLARCNFLIYKLLKQ